MRSARVDQIIYLALGLALVTSCQKNAADSGATSRTGTKTTSSTSTDTTLSFESTTPTTLYTSEVKTNYCSAFVVKAKNSAGESVSGVKIELSLSGVSAEEVATWGTLPATLTTGADGLASGQFCSASKVGTAILVANYKDAAGKSSTANSSPIQITLKPLFTLTYKGSNLATLGAAATDPIKMNLFESGPSDCGNIEFSLKKGEDPLADVQLKFQSDLGYPSGTKLRLRASTDIPYEVDAQTQRKFLSYTATSNSDGVFTIPICAGSLPGGLIVYANYTDAFGKVIYVKSPSITVGAGFASLLNLGLGFNSSNARTLQALFNNEIPTPLEFTAQINSKLGGRLSVLDPISVHLESGGITFDNNNGGVPDDNGAMKFSVIASHNGSYRPTPVYYFDSASAQASCNPIGIAGSLTSSTSVFLFKDLAKNWRSTMVYTTRGQEPYVDANDNKKYDMGGDGFWDKDQDGTYTRGIDAVTYFGSLSATPACRCLENPSAAPLAGIQATPCTENTSLPSCFRTNSEWFIDLPTPFIDADENGKYEATVNGSDMDRLIGDSYQNPNGKRDSDTTIWKSTTLPVYTGTSIYSLTRAAIGKDSVTSGITSSPSSLEYNPALQYLGWPLGVPRHANTNTTIASAAGWGSDWRYVHAQGICGTPVPGDSEISVNVVPETPEASDRSVTAHIYIQDSDDILDPSRHLLKDATGANTAKVNFNVSEHPAAAASFPVAYQLKASPCGRTPPGGTGKWCSDSRYEIKTTVDKTTVNSWLTVEEIDTSTCVSPTWKKNYQTYSCESCPKTRPKLNSATNTCEPCAFATPLFVADDNSCNACPASEPKYESSTNTCVACASDKPRYESATNTCNACGTGTEYDPATNTCKATAPAGT
jgi:hypothetical protein